MEEILYETGFSLYKRSNYISNYNNTNMWEVSIVICWAYMASTIALGASLARQVCRKQSRVLKDCRSTKRMYGCLAIDCQTAKISFD